MKTMTNDKKSLSQVRRHKASGWRLGSDCDVDYREFKLVADDLRALVGRAGYSQADDANELCTAILPVAAHRLDVLGAHIGFWQKTIREKYGDETLDDLTARMSYRHSNGCPTVGDAKAAAKALRNCSDNFVEEVLISRAFGDGIFASRLGKVMSKGASTIDNSLEWLFMLLNCVCEERCEGAYEAV
ncbi:MAG: hypothetical protein LUG52_01240 [Clostridia bacterium]|nr:hypothetical protein [Clostridia bacterium]